MDAQHEYAGCRQPQEGLLENIEPILTGHTDIEDDQVPRRLRELGQGFVGCSGFPEDDTAVFLREHLLQTVSNKQMVVHDQNLQPFHSINWCLSTFNRVM